MTSCLYSHGPMKQSILPKTTKEIEQLFASKNRKGLCLHCLDRFQDSLLTVPYDRFQLSGLKSWIRGGEGNVNASVVFSFYPLRSINNCWMLGWFKSHWLHLICCCIPTP